MRSNHAPNIPIPMSAFAALGNTDAVVAAYVVLFGQPPHGLSTWAEWCAAFCSPPASIVHAADAATCSLIAATEAATVANMRCEATAAYAVANAANAARAAARASPTRHRPCGLEACSPAHPRK